MSDRLKSLSEAGVSIWLDDLSRELIDSGELADLVARRSVVGVTTNPAIFASALKDGSRYAGQIAELKRSGADVERTVFALTTNDVQRACDALTGVARASDGVDGRVSIEVSPALAHDSQATLAQAQELWSSVDRTNALIKIPATTAGAPAITAALAEGISVNVTLIFGIDRYREVMEAYLRGLEQAHAAGLDLSTLHSVASFFVSRVDAEIDARLDALGTTEALELRGLAGLANARLAYQAYEQTFSGERWERLAAAGARTQRPLWASTGVKNPVYSDTLYVTELVAANTVNTMPRATMDAMADHGEMHGDTITGTYEDSQRVMDRLAAVGIDVPDVIAQLEREWVDKFVPSWDQLLDLVQAGLDAVPAPAHDARDA